MSFIGGTSRIVRGLRDDRNRASPKATSPCVARRHSPSVRRLTGDAERRSGGGIMRLQLEIDLRMTGNLARDELDRRRRRLVTRRIASARGEDRRPQATAGSAEIAA